MSLNMLFNGEIETTHITCFWTKIKIKKLKEKPPFNLPNYLLDLFTGPINPMLRKEKFNNEKA